MIIFTLLLLLFICINFIKNKNIKYNLNTKIKYNTITKNDSIQKIQSNCEIQNSCIVVYSRPSLPHRTPAYADAAHLSVPDRIIPLPGPLDYAPGANRLGIQTPCSLASSLSRAAWDEDALQQTAGATTTAPLPYAPGLTVLSRDATGACYIDIWFRL